MKTNLEIIREAVIAAVPEIMELKFGCWISSDNIMSNIKRMCVAELTHSHLLLTTTFGEVSRLPRTRGNYKIIGRPIRLADVLLAIEPHWRSFLLPSFMQNLDGQIKNEFEGQNLYIMVSKWNLHSDDLSLQSPETIDFLAGLLAK